MPGGMIARTAAGAACRMFAPRFAGARRARPLCAAGVLAHYESVSAVCHPAFALRFSSGARARRPVRLGVVTIKRYWPFATHWAVQVQDTWFEVGGASKQDTDSQMVVVTSQGKRSQKGADASRFGHVGFTRKSSDETDRFIEEWTRRNPRYVETRGSNGNAGSRAAACCSSVL